MATAMTTSRNSPNPVTRVLETVRAVDETGLEELQVAVDELQGGVKRLMADRELAEKRRQEEMDEIRRALSKLARDVEVRQGKQPRVETTMGLEPEVGEGPTSAAAVSRECGIGDNDYCGNIRVDGFDNRLS
ncbi:unnamed protein product [Linum trigynum]|uniref:Uncharacterized protein n=1 Tax=Linum trigynum TaxID=586398 RepID=A0AAV2F8G1_9ROSI